MEKLLAFDAANLEYRWYHRMAKDPLMHNGIDTSVLHGFLYTLLSLASRYKPKYLVACLESRGKSFRHEKYAEYKAQRPPKPEGMQEAEDRVEELCKALNIPLLRIEGVEGDDVIGSVVRVAQEAGVHSYIVSGDKDFCQLVNANVTQVQPQFKGGYKELDVPAVCEKWGIDQPGQVREILALWGDTSDNIPGVRGIGEKRSRDLIQEYGTAVNAFRHRGELTESLESKLTEDEQNLIISRWLVEIRQDLQSFIDLEKLRWQPTPLKDAAPALDKYGLTKIKELLKEYAQPFGKQKAPT